jgi:hypothetical protein
MQEKFSSGAKMSLPKKIMPLRGVLEFSCRSDQRSDNKVKAESCYSDIP